MACVGQVGTRAYDGPNFEIDRAHNHKAQPWAVACSASIPFIVESADSALLSLSPLRSPTT